MLSVCTTTGRHVRWVHETRTLVIAGVLHAELVPHSDERGRFVEICRSSDFPDLFVQANHSRSAAGVLRGLHWHRHQADLWYVIRGRIRVVMADLRVQVARPSVVTLEMDGDEPASLYIPPGVAHGFLALTPVDLTYWVTAEYDASDEHGLAWDDPTLAVDWGIAAPVLSERDRNNPPLSWDAIAAFS